MLERAGEGNLDSSVAALSNPDGMQERRTESSARIEIPSFMSSQLSVDVVQRPAPSTVATQHAGVIYLLRVGGAPLISILTPTLGPALAFIGVLSGTVDIPGICVSD